MLAKVSFFERFSKPFEKKEFFNTGQGKKIKNRLVKTPAFTLRLLIV